VRASIDALINIYITKPPGSKKLENVTRGVQVSSCLGVRVDAVLIQEVDTPWGIWRSLNEWLQTPVWLGSKRALGDHDCGPLWKEELQENLKGQQNKIVRGV
jgi:hypothetical protein